MRIVKTWVEGREQELRVFTPGEVVEHNGRAAFVVAMEMAGENFTGHVVLSDHLGQLWKAWANFCHKQKLTRHE